MAAPLAATATGEIAILRAASYRIAAASPQSLPAVVAHVVASLHQCKRLLSQPQSARQKDGEAGLVVHRLNTQITSLLQSRTHQERWAAAALIKAYSEAGGWEVLSKSASKWVAGLVGNLKKHGPPLARTTMIMTLTRIFTLTWGNPSLIREITTPSLPGFITACLGLIGGPEANAKTLSAVLNAFTHLAPRHPAIFRTFLDKIKSVTRDIARCATQPQALRALASRLAVVLHHCKPKDTAAASWTDDLTVTINEAHTQLDRLLDGVQEHWQSQSERGATDSATQLPVHDAPARVEAVHNAADALPLLLTHCDTLLSTPTSMVVSVRIGMVSDLLSRLYATAGCLGLPSAQSTQFKPDVTREEQHAVLAVLPTLHASVLAFTHLLVSTHHATVLPILQPAIDQLVWIFRSEYTQTQVRSAAYNLLSTILDTIGPSLSKEVVTTLLTIIKACCTDLIDAPGDTSQLDTAADKDVSQVNADSISRKTTTATVAEPARNLATAAAQSLLPVLLAKLPSKCVPDAIRIQMDRTALLTRNKEALLASVLNPPAVRQGQRASASLLPFLAREYPQDPQVEALLRPRMPIIQTTGRRKGQTTDDGDDDSSDVGIESLHADDEVTPIDEPVESAPANNEPSKKRVAENVTTEAKRQRASPSSLESAAPALQPMSEVPVFDLRDQATTAAVHDYEAPVASVTTLFGAQPQESATEKLADVDDEDFEMPELDLREDSDEEDDA